jgi:hypothetical protein
MEGRPTVTHAGDPAVFGPIQPGLVGGLSTESVEWKRPVQLSPLLTVGSLGPRV